MTNEATKLLSQLRAKAITVMQNFLDKVRAEPRTTIALFALLISILSLGISVRLTYTVNLSPGELIIHPPTEFCIARGYQVFPSDHVIIPVYIENTGRGAKAIGQPTLFITDPHTRKLKIYLLAGYLPDIGLGTFGNDWYEIARGIVVPERSLQRYVLVFHSERWWDEASPDFIYRFIHDGISVKNYEMQFGYYEVPDGKPIYWRQKHSNVFLSMPVYGTVNRLQLRQSSVDNLLQLDDVTAQPDLVEFLEKHPTGTYNIDCFADEDFPDPPGTAKQ